MKTKNLNYKIYFIFFCAVLLFFYSFNTILAKDFTLPFSPGETLTFKLYWSVLPVGKAKLEVLPIEIINGKKAYHFRLTVKSNFFVDLIYKIRDQIDGYTDLNMKHSIFYKKNINEGKNKKDIIVNFDLDNNKAQFSNFDKKNKPISIIPGSFDPLSILYSSRLFTNNDIENKDHIQVPVTDGKKSLIGITKILKKEKIKINGKTYETFLVEPDLKDIEQIFTINKNSPIQIWVTTDDRRIPVKLKTKVKGQYLVGELDSIKY